MISPASRRIWLCADDYGLSPGVNRGIRELIAQRRLNATSVMLVGAAIDRDEVAALRTVAADSACAIGLHVTLTAPFHPLTMYFRPLHGGVFLPLGRLLGASLTRQLDREIIGGEITAQLARFAELFGRAPDYVDGHQHVQLFPQIREAFLAAVRAAAPRAWVRQCGRSVRGLNRFSPPKALLLDMLSAGFRRRCDRLGVAYNAGFAGAYDFSREADFGDVMPRFLEGLPDRGLMMCHPGYVDDTLISLDPLTTQRRREFDYLGGDHLPLLFDAASVALIDPAAALTKN